MRRDDVLQALSNAADGSLIPATLPDQAGAVREQLGALSRRPIRERRLADLMPLAWVAALVAALVLLVQTGSRRGASLAALGMLTMAGRAPAQRAAARRPAGAGGEVVRGHRGVSPGSGLRPGQ